MTMPAKVALGAVLGLAVVGCTATQGPRLDGNEPVVDTAHYGPPEVNRWTGSAPTVVESYGQDSARQFGELRVPEGKGPFPVAMLIHGGCWANMGSTANMVPMADWLRARGVATWNVDYRELDSGGGWPGSFNDWAGALAALKTLAGRYPLDLTRITTVGHSAGALPAVWLASGSQGDAVVARDLPLVRSVIVLDGPIELLPFRDYDENVCGRPVIDMLLGGTPETVAARYEMVDPLKNPPVSSELVIVDGALPPQIPASLASLRARGITVTEISVAQDQHFDLLKPGTADFAAIAPTLLRVTRGR